MKLPTLPSFWFFFLRDPPFRTHARTRLWGGTRAVSCHDRPPKKGMEKGQNSRCSPRFLCLFFERVTQRACSSHSAGEFDFMPGRSPGQQQRTTKKKGTRQSHPRLTRDGHKGRVVFFCSSARSLSELTFSLFVNV